LSSPRLHVTKEKKFGVEYYNVGIDKWIESDKKFTTESQAERHIESLLKHGYSPNLTRLKKL